MRKCIFSNISLQSKMYSDATIVSSYYKIPSKKSHEFYVEPVKRFLGHIHNPIVFFTTEDLVEELQSYRNNLPIHFIILPLHEFVAFQRYGYDFWKKQCAMDIEKYHTPELCALWYEKRFFVKRAIEQNPFQSNYFIWCDAGCARTDKWIPYLKTFGQNTSAFSQTHLQFQHIYPIHTCFGTTIQAYAANTKNEAIETNNPYPLFLFMFPHMSIAGAIIGGTPSSWEWFYDAYDWMVFQYVHHKICVNMDQNIMHSLACNFPDKIECINFEKQTFALQCPDRWFFFLMYYSTHLLE